MTATSVARSEKPNLIIFDLGLPAGDDYLVLDQLNIQLMDIPVIVVSVRDEHVHKDQVWAPGAKADLQKRLMREVLRDLISRFLGPAALVAVRQ